MDSSETGARRNRATVDSEDVNRSEAVFRAENPSYNPTAGRTLSMDPGAVEFTLQGLHKDTRKMLEMQVSIMQQVTKLETSLQLMARDKNPPADYSWECKVCLKPKDVVKIPDNELECVIGPYAVTQVVQLFCVVASSSFALQAENGRWVVPEETLACFSSDESIMTGGSGLAALFFAVKNNLKRQKFASGVGRLWAFLMREAVIETVKYARDVLYAGSSEDGAPPQWLQYMQDNAKVRKSVAHVYTKLEGQDTRPRSRRSGSGTGSTAPSASRSASARTPSRSRDDSFNMRSGEEILARKRRRMEAGPSRGTTGMVDNVAAGRSGLSQGDMETTALVGSQGDPGNQYTAIFVDDRAGTVDEVVRREFFKTARGKHVQYLNSGRTDIRSNLHRDLMFLKEFIETHFDPTKRRSKGFLVPEGATALQIALTNYEYVFLEDPETELAIPEVIRKDSRWDIPLAETVDEDMCVKILTNKAEGIASNLKTMEKMAEKFPCLSVGLRYKREVRCASGTSVAFPEDTEAPGTVWYQELEKVSLHDIALGIIVERFKARYKISVLCFSPLSFRTVHILAIEIFGLLRRSLGLSITTLEEIALGNAVHAMVGSVEDKVSTMLENESESGRKKVMRSQNISEKMVMSTKEYDRRTKRTVDAALAPSVVSEGAVSLTSGAESRDVEEVACARDDNPSWKLGRGRGRGRGR